MTIPDCWRNGKDDANIVVLVNFVAAAPDMDGDEFAVILRPESRPHLSVEDISLETGVIVSKMSHRDGIPKPPCRTNDTDQMVAVSGAAAARDPIGGSSTSA